MTAFHQERWQTEQDHITLGKIVDTLPHPFTNGVFQKAVTMCTIWDMNTVFGVFEYCSILKFIFASESVQK